MTKWKVVSSAVTFGKFNKGPVDILVENNCEIIINPYGRPFTDEEFIRHAGDADALIVGNDIVSGDLIKKLPSLKVIAKHGVGVDGIDRETAKELGIVVTNAPETNKYEVADSVIGFMLLISRSYLYYNKSIKEGGWDKFPGKSLRDKTIGIIGVGNIGTQVAKRATGFEMTILGNDIVERDVAKKLGVEYVSLDYLIEKSDFISINVPLDESTYHIVGEKEIALMKSDAVLVNTARGKCIDEEALLENMKKDRILGYGLDVYDFEPPELKELYLLDNVFLTPHVAGTTYDSNLRMGSTAVENVIAVKNDQVPPNKCN